MISLTSIPERIAFGETLKIKLDIQGKINLNTYKSSYFNLTIRKNSSQLGSITLYPLRFNGNPLEWEVNPNSYGSDGTFSVNCTLQNGPSVSNTTFIVEPDCKVLCANEPKNLTCLIQTANTKHFNVKKQEQVPEYLRTHQVQKPGSTYVCNEIEKEVSKNKKDTSFNEELISTSKVQRKFKDC